MQKLVFRNANGIELDLTTDPFGITEWEGFSADELNIQSQQVPFQDGGVFLDALLGERELAVTVAMNDGNDLEKRYRLRRQMISALNPKLGEGVLIYTNDFLSKQIHVIPQLPVFENHNSNDSGTPKANCVFNACNPYWEDLEETVVEIQEYDIPEINNNGDIEAPMKIELVTQGVTNPAIINTSNNQKIQYTGILNDNIIINTNFGKKECYISELKYKTTYPEKLNSITYSPKQGLFVIGADGVVVTSYDLEKWEIKDLDVPLILSQIKWDSYRELYIIIGTLRNSAGQYSNTIITTEDFVNLTQVYSTQPASNVPTPIRMQILEDEVVVVFDNGDALISNQELTTWTKYTNSFTFKDLIYVEQSSLFVALVTSSHQDSVVTSSDAQTWTTENTFQDDTYERIIYSEQEGKYVMVGSDKWAICENLQNWIVNNLAGPTRYSICYSNEDKQFVSLQKYNTPQGLLKFSYPGSPTLSEVQIEGIEEGEINDIMYSELFKMYIAVGDQIIISKDSNEWENKTNYINTEWSEMKVKYDEQNERFILCNQHSVYTSKDGEILNLKSTFTTDIIDFVICDGYYILATGQTLKRSYNLIDWETVWTNTNTSFSIKCLGYGVLHNQKIVLVSITTSTISKIVSSSDGGTSWVENSFTIFGVIQKINISDNTIVAGGHQQDSTSLPLIYRGNNITVSQWERVTITESGTVVDIIYNLDQWVVITDEGFVHTSKSAVGWKNVSRTITATSIFYSVADGVYIVVGNGIAVSSNLTEWKDIESSSVRTYSAISGNDDRSVICGQCVKVDEHIKGENVIANLSADSDINFRLLLGKNVIRLTESSGNFKAIVTYRQKYVGV